MPIKKRVSGTYRCPPYQRTISNHPLYIMTIESSK
ncbi:hypothetical protein SLEP1_g18955 [Rubroshorea leprosula]|uniref:Ribosomal protein L16 n=1 Tax=Rubroshorea leprosula TaxID=152421 RepID=A0AAV5J572_9ROSI|nr:hypothetical protein SLEP1_g18955 [Rubroshorea leprosula]